MPNKEVSNKYPLSIMIKSEKHMRIKVLWKAGTVLWCAADSLRIQNPFIFIPYNHKRNLYEHRNCKWVKSYTNQEEEINKLFKVNRLQKKSSQMPKFKFGLQVPNDPAHVIKLDNMNQDNQWSGAMNTEIGFTNDFEMFIILEDHQHAPTGYKQILYHVVFDVKFDGRRKARLVAGGHRVPEVPKEEVYAVGSINGNKKNSICNCISK